MGKYYSTFITGLQDLVKTGLEENLNDIKIDLILDGLIVYQTKSSKEKIKDIRFINNSFILLCLLKQKGKFTLKEFINQVIRGPGFISNISGELFKNIHSFRVIISDENELKHIDNILLKDSENIFSKKYRLKIDRGNPDVEIWFMTRSEGYGFVGLRITKKPNYEKTLHKGEIRPELANLMCLVADLKYTDTVLDPFAGYGSIPKECERSYKVKKIIAGEINRKIFHILCSRINRINITTGRWDALNLTSLTDKSVDKIITDPPWGIYEILKQDITAFYHMMITEFIRILKPKGLIVVLTSQKEVIEKVLKYFPSLTLLRKFDTLVSGKKAAIYKIQLKSYY